MLGCSSVRPEPSPSPTLSPVFLPRRGTSPGCLQALFRLGTYPGSFNPRPDGKSCWHCWQREGPHTIVSFMKHTSQEVPVWGGSLAGSTGLPLSHLNIGRARGASPTCQLGVIAITNKGFSKEETQRLPPESWGRGRSRSRCLVRVPLRSTKKDRHQPGKGLPRALPEGSLEGIWLGWG